MKITIKTLKNKKYDLEIQETDDVVKIKQMVHEKFNLGTPDQMKLIHHGKILRDAQTAKEAGFKNDDFIVLMVRKIRKKKAKQVVADPPAPQASAAPANNDTTANNESAPAVPAPISSESAAPEAPSSSNPAPSTDAPPAQGSSDASGANAFVTGTQLQETITNFMGMGFSRDQSMAAMRAAYNNPERAAEYLLNGIPDNVGPQVAPAPAPIQGSNDEPMDAPPAPANNNANQNANDNANALGGGQANAMDAMRQMFMNNPQALQGIIQQIGAQNPELAQALQNNPQAIQKLMQDPNVMNMLLANIMAQMGGAGRGGGGLGGVNPLGGGGGGGVRPPANAIRLTQEEAAAVNRLKAMGFSEANALEAYLVCGKNEQLAANYMFDNPDFGPAPAPAPVANNENVPQNNPAPANNENAEPAPPAPENAGNDAPGDRDESMEQNPDASGSGGN